MVGGWPGWLHANLARGSHLWKAGQSTPTQVKSHRYGNMLWLSRSSFRCCLGIKRLPTHSDTPSGSWLRFKSTRGAFRNQRTINSSGATQWPGEGPGLLERRQQSSLIVCKERESVTFKLPWAPKKLNTNMKTTGSRLDGITSNTVIMFGFLLPCHRYMLSNI